MSMEMPSSQLDEKHDTDTPGRVAMSKSEGLLAPDAASSPPVVYV